MQITMFVTPVLWPKDLLGSNLAFAADLNPLYHLTRIMRDPLLGVAVPLEEAGFGPLPHSFMGSIVTFWVYGKQA